MGRKIQRDMVALKWLEPVGNQSVGMSKIHQKIPGSEKSEIHLSRRNFRLTCLIAQEYIKTYDSYDVLLKKMMESDEIYKVLLVEQFLQT